MDMPRGVYERQGSPVADTNTAKAKTGTPGAAVHRTTPVRENETRTTPGIAYIALKPMKVEGVRVQPGDAVPQASTWRNVHNYVSAGYLAAVSS